MRYLGIDYGEKRVGLALSDQAGHFALPFRVLPNSPKLSDDIAKICREQGVAKVILGESRDWQGQANPIMKRIRSFAVKLAATGLQVVFEPEFLTSAEAARLRGPAHDLDAAAAALILKSYIDRQSR